MSSPFNLIMVAAYMEAGGNCLQRHLDGHPRLISAPFETQVGTSYSSSLLTPLYHFRYAWPVFPLGIYAVGAYQMMYDEETKTYLRTFGRSKFRECGLEMDEDVRLHLFEHDCEYTRTSHADWGDERINSRADYVRAYFVSTAGAWVSRYAHETETHYVGYYPLATVDTDLVLSDFPSAHILHITRNPFSSYADTKKRPFVLPLTRYIAGWNIDQMYARVYASKYPRHFHTFRFEDFIADKRGTLAPILDTIGVGWSDACAYPSFNGRKLETIYPWGTIKHATPEANLSTARELTRAEIRSIMVEAAPMISAWGYEGFGASL